MNIDWSDILERSDWSSSSSESASGGEARVYTSVEMVRGRLCQYKYHIPSWISMKLSVVAASCGSNIASTKLVAASYSSNVALTKLKPGKRNGERRV